MTIRKLLNGLELDEKRCVLVNNKEISVDMYGEYVLTPKDDIVLLSFIPESPSKEQISSKMKMEEQHITKEGLIPELGMNEIREILSKFFDPNYDLEGLQKMLKKIPYNPDAILEACKMLESTKYNDLEVFVYGKVNWEILAILRDKFNRGEMFSEREMIIAQVAVFQQGKGNSESEINENSFEKTKRNNKIIGILKVIGKSMLGKLKPGAKVAYKIKGEGDLYEVGDIIVFYNKYGLKVVHEVVSYKDSNGERTYTTKGVNNQDIDSDPVSGDNVIGKVVDFSKQELVGLIKMAEQGRIPYIEALGMSNEFENTFIQNELDKVYQSLYKTSKSVRNMRDNPIGLTREQLLDFVINKISEINTEDFRSSEEIDKLDEIRTRILTTCSEMIERNVYSWFSKDLSKKMISYLYKEFIYPSGKSTHPVSSDYFIDQVLILGEVLKSLNNYYEPKIFKKNLEALLKSREFRSYENIGSAQKPEFINNLIKSVWKDTYEKLSLKLLDREFKYKDKEALYFEPDDVLIEKTTCTTVLKNPKYKFFQPTEIYLTFGEHNFDPGGKRIGNGIIHIYAGHWRDFARLHRDLNTPEAIAKFIFELIKSQKGVVMESRGKIIYAFRFKGEDITRFVEILIDDGKMDSKGNFQNGPEGRLHTAYPVDASKKEYRDKLRDYRIYFRRHTNLIQMNVDLEKILD